MKSKTNLDVLEKIKTGIEGFEGISHGGLTKGRTTLLVGSSGSGKTVFAVEFLYRGIMEFNRSGVFITMEERPEEIIRNVKQFNWHLDQLVEQKKMMFIDAAPHTELTEEVGRYDLSGLIAQLKYAIESVQAEVVILDSIGSLFSQFSDTQIIRREIFRMVEVLRDLGVTAIMTAERLEEYGAISRYGIEEFVSDNVIILRNILAQETSRRTIQILKMRGTTHLKGESPFMIASDGIKILSLSAMELNQSTSSLRVSSGNPDLDEMTHGGLFQDSIILISGPTGSGKTLICTTFTNIACQNHQKVLMFAYEESRPQLLRNALSWGVDFQELEQKGLLRICCLYPETQGPEEHLLMIRREIEAFRPQRVVVDSISAMERIATVRDFREFVIGLTSYVKQEEICSLFTSTTPNLSGGDSITEAHISTITDVIILLRYVETNGALRRGIAVIKVRGSQHQKEVREFTIDNNGLHIGEPFKNVQNIILGIPSSIRISEQEYLGRIFGDRLSLD